jgi:uncharacterized protein YndB with AHSA1/START domain
MPSMPAKVARSGFRSHTMRRQGPVRRPRTTDTYHGRFVKLVPDEKMVEVDEFETDDPGLCGQMTITITPADANGGTDLIAVHDRLPRGVSPADNENRLANLRAVR